MKRVFLMVLCLVCMIMNIQNCIACQFKTSLDFTDNTASKSTEMLQQHLSFKGLSFGTKTSTFLKSLSSKGFKFEDSPTDEYGFYGKGTICGITGFDVHIDFNENLDEICIIEASKTFQKAEIKTILEKIFKNIKAAYPNYKSEKSFITYDEHFNFTKYCPMKIFSKDGCYVGNIYILYHTKYKDLVAIQHKIEIKYVDYQNYHEWQKKWNYTNYDISSLTNAYFKNCNMQVEDIYIRFNITKGNKEYSCFALDMDRDEILQTLFSDETSEKKKKDLLRKYFLLEVIDSEDPNMYAASQKFFCKTKYDYENAVAEKNYNNSIIDSILNGNSTGEKMFLLWEGSGRILNYKKDGTYNKRYQLFRQNWNAAVGAFSNSSSTNWDGLSDAQKAAIHEHDNAR